MHDNTIDKLYRHEALLYAIDFFSQGVEIGQIANYAFDFANEILTLNFSAIFLKEEEDFILSKSKGYDLKSYKICAVDKLNNIAKFHGDIIKSNFQAFLEEKELEIFRPKLIIPLMVQDKTLGLLISNGKVIGELNNNDYNIATILMRLINKSLENTLYAEELKQKNKELDLQLFNHFFINHTTKILLSELDIESLYTLCTDIVGEVVCSKITAFGLYDEIKEKIVIRSYRDIFSFKKLYTELELLTKGYSNNKIIFNYNEDREEIKGIFKNWEEFEKLEAEYIILIVKDKILGFITISEPVNDREYNKIMFDLVESLASIIYIAISNGNLFKKIDQQKYLIEKKYNVLQKLSRIVKNINSSSNIEELSHRTMKTLNIGFSIEKALAIFKQNGRYEIVSTIGFDTKVKEIVKTDIWKLVDDSGITYEFSSIHNEKYFDKELYIDMGESNCLVISPIKIGNISFEEEDNVLGYIVVLQTRRSLEAEEIVLIDTISGSIAPIIKQLNNIQQIKKEYILNEQELFLKDLREKFFSKEKYFIDFKIYYKKIIKKPFEELDFTAYSHFDYYYFDNYLLVLSEYDLSEEDFDDYIELNTFDEIFEVFQRI